MKKLIFSILAMGLGLIIQAQTIPIPPQTDEIIIDNGSSGKADPNDRIRYKVTIQNTGGANGTGTQLNIVPDPRTTFVPGSFRSSPLALNDAYTCTGNVGLNVSAANGLKANDFDDNIAAATITAGSFATTQGGTIVIAADGGFQYTPPAGYTGSDTYTYTLNDSNGVGGDVPATDMATVTFTISNLIWFIDNNAAAGDGRRNSPFNSLSAFNSGSAAAGDVIYVEHTGTNYTGGIVLQNNERLFGEGHTGGANLADVLPFTLAPHSFTLPVINGSRPVITNTDGDGVTLASNNTLRGFNVGNCSDFGIENSGTNSVGNLIVSEVSINNTLGGGFDASHGSGASMNAVFTSISSSGGINGINLTNCQGIFTVNGGTITNPSGPGVLISGGSVTVSCAAAVSDNTGFAVDIDDHDSNNVTLSGNITTSGTGIRIQNCGGGIKTFSGNITTSAGTAIVVTTNNGGTINFSGSSKSLSTGSNTAVNLTSNTGATINFTNGGLAITTTSGMGFNATGGGTVTVQGTGNTINSVSATALNVASTSIGASGLTFQSISSGNNTVAADPVNGIVLNNTGASGGLTVTGTSTTSGSGGTIQFTSNDGISINNAVNVSLTNMIIQDIGNMAGGHNTNSGHDGMQVSALTGLILDNVIIRRISDNAILGAVGASTSTIITGLQILNCTIEDSNRFHVAGTGDANNEGTVRILGITGTVIISNSNFQRGAKFLDFVTHTSGTLNMTVTNCNFLYAYKEFTAGVLASVGIMGIDVISEGSAIANITIGNLSNSALGNTFLNCRLASVRLGNNPGATGNLTYIVSNNSFTVDDHSSGIGGNFDFPMGGLLLSSLGANSVIANAIVSHNYFDEVTNANGGVGQLTLSMQGGTWQALVENNTFDTPGNAPFFIRADTGNSTVLFRNNTYIRGGFCSPDPASAGPGCGGCGDGGMGPGFCGPGLRSLVQAQNGGSINISFINEAFAKHDSGFDPGNTVEVHVLATGNTACANFVNNSSPEGYSVEQYGGTLNVQRGASGTTCTGCTALQMQTVFGNNGNTGGSNNPLLNPPAVTVVGTVNTTNTACPVPSGGIFN